MIKSPAAMLDHIVYGRDHVARALTASFVKRVSRARASAAFSTA
jgi:hypothetical protein